MTDQMQEAEAYRLAKLANGTNGDGHRPGRMRALAAALANAVRPARRGRERPPPTVCATC